MTTRKALIVGATGLIGGHCLQRLLDDPGYSEVIALVRKPIVTTHKKLKIVETDFNHLEKDLDLISAHDVFCCLGTTIKKAGSREAFRKIDLDLVVIIAELMKKQGAEQFIVISSMGADKNSKVFYSRTKGEMEEVLKGIGYQCLRIIRPSLLLGKRDEFRLAERLGGIIFPLLKPLMVGGLRKYAPVQAESVAQFMVKVAQDVPITGVHFYESNQIS
jgi:uncharacterized protein YbjT (DUF2867 family)